MSRQRAFYVTQGSLTVWKSRRGHLEQVAEFADNDDGLRRFDAYLAEHNDQPSFIIIDVIEEEFAPDSIPKLGFGDRKSLLMRRLQRKFPRTRYRLPILQGKKRGADKAMVVHSAISNHELLDPWVQILLNHEVPLQGIYSVPLMAPDLMRRLSKTQQPVMLLTQHHGQKLRQVFLNNGQVQSARLSQSPPVSDEEYPQFLLTEIGRSRRYLERTRLLSGMEQLDVYIVAEPALAERILACETSQSPLQIHFVRPEKAAARVGLDTDLQADRMELLYLAMSFEQRPRHSYAVSGETRFWQMRRLRHATIGAAVGIGCLCSAMAGLYISDAWFLNRQANAIEQQLTQLTETFRRENERFDPMQADSHEMKLAVDTGDFILSNRLPVPWVMQQVGMVMGDYQDVQILTLDWSAESMAQEEPRRRRNDQPMPVPVPAIVAVNAVITADILSFDGNMRSAFERIDELVEDLEAKTHFSDVAAIEYPLDARPEASISGEIVRNSNAGNARFRIMLRYPLDQAAATGSEINDEAV